MDLLTVASYYLFVYPLVMSVVWIIGGTFFYWRRERNAVLPQLESFPMVSILVPCHNEAAVIKETVSHLLQLDYPHYEVVVVDDGSTDGTPELLNLLMQELPFRTVFLKRNAGKPTALNTGLLACRGQIIMTVDADAILDEKALHWIVWHFIKFPRVGAVTANPRVRNRTTLLAKIQTAEYSSIIGLIKRTQRILGKIMTVSGVATAFRLRALVDVGLWDFDMITDDINMTWKLEKKFWDIRYEPNALCWMLAPETLGGLWKQRKRWSQGGIEVLRRHADIWLSWKCRRLWPVYLDQVLAIAWSTAFVFLSGVWVASLFVPVIPVHFSPVIRWYGVLLSFLCLAQFLVAMLLDRKYDPTLMKYYAWVIWYPVAYWVLNALTVVFALPKALFRPMGVEAVWTSPDRGILPQSDVKK